MKTHILLALALALALVGCENTHSGSLRYKDHKRELDYDYKTVAGEKKQP